MFNLNLIQNDCLRRYGGSIEQKNTIVAASLLATANLWLLSLDDDANGSEVRHC
jgi:hypothetical protein